MQDLSLRPSFKNAIKTWWHENAVRVGSFETLRRFMVGIYDFLRDSVPQMRQRRFGDLDYDFDFRVNTTAGTVGWRDRLLGVFHSPYQATDPAVSRDDCAPSGRLDFTWFIDLGSGKGRTLLMASDYPLRKILGVELIPELNRVAQQNIRDYQSSTQQCETSIRFATHGCSNFPLSPWLFSCSTPLLEGRLSHGYAEIVAVTRTKTAPGLDPLITTPSPRTSESHYRYNRFQKVCGTSQYVLYRSMARS